MKPNELRIGNKVYGLFENDDGELLKDECTILGIDSVGFSEFTYWVDGNLECEMYDSFEPIPLTEEWLIKFGFEWTNGYGYRFLNGWIKLNDGVWKSYDLTAPCKYAHQLQNIYFALTGEELTI